MSKKMTIVALGVLSVSAMVALALPEQAAGANDDEKGVRQAVLNYINSFYQTKPGLLEESVHANLKKRNLRETDDGKVYLNEMTRSQLVAFAYTANANGQWSDSSRKDVIIYDIDGDIASAKLVAENWVDYFHLAKMDGKWVIVNVLWAGR